MAAQSQVRVGAWDARWGPVLTSPPNPYAMGSRAYLPLRGRSRVVLHLARVRDRVRTGVRVRVRARVRVRVRVRARVRARVMVRARVRVRVMVRARVRVRGMVVVRVRVMVRARG